MEGIKTFAEFIEPDVEVDVEVVLDKRYFNSFCKVGKRISFEQLQNSCKSFYGKVLNHEKQMFFKAFDTEIKMSQISELYDRFLKINENQKSVINSQSTIDN